MSIHQNSKLGKQEEARPIYAYHSKHKPSKHTSKPNETQGGEVEFDENGNLRMINDSMIELQDPAFVQNQIDDFQNRLQITVTQRGFCKVTRDQSLLLSNTQGYRKYKSNMNLYRSRSKQSISKEAQVKNQKEKIKQQQPKKYQEIVKNGNTIQKKQSQVSLTYSNESQINENQRKKQRKQKITNKSSILPQLVPNQIQQTNN